MSVIGSSLPPLNARQYLLMTKYTVSVKQDGHGDMGRSSVPYILLSLIMS